MKQNAGKRFPWLPVLAMFCAMLLCLPTAALAAEDVGAVDPCTDAQLYTAEFRGDSAGLVITNPTPEHGKDYVTQLTGSAPHIQFVWIHCGTTQNVPYTFHFIDNIPIMEKGYDYCFSFKLTDDKYGEGLEFPMFLIATMLPRVDADELAMGCSVERSDDGQNHFALLRRKQKKVKPSFTNYALSHLDGFESCSHQKREARRPNVT